MFKARNNLCIDSLQGKIWTPFFFSVIHKKRLTVTIDTDKLTTAKSFSEKFPVSALDYAGNGGARGRESPEPPATNSTRFCFPWVPVGRRGTWPVGWNKVGKWDTGSEELAELETQTCSSTAPAQRGQAFCLLPVLWQGAVPTQGSKEKEVCSQPKGKATMVFDTWNNTRTGCHAVWSLVLCFMWCILCEKSNFRTKQGRKHWVN